MVGGGVLYGEDGARIGEVRDFRIEMSAVVGPFKQALDKLAELGEAIKLVRSQTASFELTLRQNGRELRRMFGVEEPRARRHSTPHRRKHPVLRRRSGRSQTRRVR